MPKSIFAENLDHIQQEMSHLLKPLGFIKKGRTYNRTAGDGMIHTINFQMGNYPIGNYVIPGFRESFYGLFAINLGVFLPCVWEAEGDLKVKPFIQEYYCQIRERLGSLANDGKDVWWQLEKSIERTAETVVMLMKNYGLPFLDTFPDYQSVIAYYQKHLCLPFSNKGRSALSVAIIQYHLGQIEAAHEQFSTAIQEYPLSGEFPKKVMRKLGI